MEKRDIVDDCRVTRYRRNEFKIKKKNSILHKFDISISFVVLHDIMGCIVALYPKIERFTRKDQIDVHFWAISSFS